MISFEQFLHLKEGVISSEIRDELEKLQRNWVENADKYLSAGIYPILERPYDQVIRNGIMVLGINHAVDHKRFEEVMKAFDGDAMAAIYDKKTKTWPLNIDVENKKVERSRINDKLSNFLDTLYVKNKKRPSDVSVNGRYFYHATFNKILEKLDLEVFKPKLYAVDIIPYGSVNQSVLKKEFWDMSRPWFTKFMSVAKPKLIFCSFAVLDELKKTFKYKQQDIIKSKYKMVKGNNARLFETGYIGEYPVVVLPHWSGAFGLKPHNDKTVDEEAEYIRNAIYLVMNNKLAPEK